MKIILNRGVIFRVSVALIVSLATFIPLIFRVMKSTELPTTLLHVIFSSPHNFEMRSMYRLISTPLFVIQVGEHDSLTDLQLFLEANRHSDIYLNSNSSSISSLLYFNTPNPPSSHILFSNDTVIIQNPARLKSIATDCLAVFDTSLNLFEDSAILLSTKLLSTYPGPPNLINLVKHALDEGDCSTPDHLVFYNHPKSKTGISHAFVGDGILIGGLRTPQMMLEALDAFTYKGDTFS